MRYRQKVESGEQLAKNPLVDVGDAWLQLDDDNATNDGTGGDDDTDNYVKAQNIWGMGW